MKRVHANNCKPSERKEIHKYRNKLLKFSKLKYIGYKWTTQITSKQNGFKKRNKHHHKIRGSGKFSFQAKLGRKGLTFTKNNYKHILKKVGTAAATGGAKAAGTLLVNKIVAKDLRKKCKNIKGKGIGGYIQAGKLAFDI